MKKLIAPVVLTLGCLALAIGSGAVALAEDTKSQAAKTAKEAPNPDEQVRALEKMCAESAEARGKRHADTPLFERLGQEKKIHALTREIVRLHRQNEAIKHLLDGVDDEHLAHGVAQFMISGMGGPPVYEGPSLTDSHAHLKLTNADFMAAGADVIQAMKNLEYGQNEIDEVVCALVSMREQVVLAK